MKLSSTASTDKAREYYRAQTPSSYPLDWDTLAKRGPQSMWHIQVICPSCGRRRWCSLNQILNPSLPEFTGLCRSCSSRRVNKESRRKAGGWDGVTTTSEGYTAININFLPREEQIAFASMANVHHPYIKEHRLVIARHLNRPLLRSEIVHHINGDKKDNRIENLRLLVRVKHPNTNGEVFYQELQEAQAEVKRLRSILDQHGISY